MAERLTLKPGKGDVIKRLLPSGEVEDVCECLYNFDITRGCIGKVPVELLREVWENGGTYSPERIARSQFGKKNKFLDIWTPNGYYTPEEPNVFKKEGYALPKVGCDYCYATGWNAGNITPREIKKETLEEFTESSFSVIRLGKSTEVGHPFHWPLLKEVLKLFEEREKNYIFPTKTLPFGLEGASELSKYARGGNDIVYEIAKANNFPPGEELAERLMKTGGTLTHSTGWNSMEDGICSQGFVNEWRIEQAKLFHKMGLNNSLTVVCDVSSSIKHNTFMGNYIEVALKAGEKTGINVRVIPSRYASKEAALKGIGIPWDVAIDESRISQNSLFDEIEIRGGNYMYKRSGEIMARHIHPDFKKLLDEGMGFCGQIGDMEYCDKCNLPGMEDVRISFPTSELAERDTSGIGNIKWGNKNVSAQKKFKLKG